MLERFAAGYYLGQLYVEPHEGVHALMDRSQHEQANERIYSTGYGIERLDQPLIVKLDGHHLPVVGSTNVPRDTLRIPERIQESINITNPPTLKEILIAKADLAGPLLDWFTQYSIPTATDT